ncbi:MAG TPA: glycosyltransferase family 2 protein [Candidatus Binatia bacterium]|nr:glycosyltransferase family 2 protein [Candidatus Binatia bacterium]
MRNIEIPYEQDRHFIYRSFEILPGALSWLVLFMPLILSLIDVSFAVVFIVAYLLVYFVRSVGVDIRALQGYRIMKQHQRLVWKQLLIELEDGIIDEKVIIERPKWHERNITRLIKEPTPVKPSEVIHAVMVATYNESLEVLEPTIQSVLASTYDPQQIILILAYEERGGERTEENVKILMAKYGARFRYAMAVKHPKDIPGEVIGKGGNVTYAGRELQKYLEQEKIDPIRVIVTTLDADNRPHTNYFGALSYIYCITPDPLRVSYQPIIMYTNNIWDVPAPMRVLATGNSLWDIVLTMRTHMLRNFSSHAQGMKALIETDFWSVRTIVEDGHQFWRSYFRFNGKYEVYPIYIPIYQDAVFSRTYVKTLKAQFIQLRRWTYGASDVAYVAYMGFLRKNSVPKRDLITKFLRMLEGHISWAVAPPLLAFSAFVPALINPQSYAANILPLIISRVQEIALAGALASVFICFKTLPPKPARYKAHRNILIILQWIYLPVVGLVYTSSAAIYSQTRLMFGWYIGKFDVTEKAVVGERGRPRVV